MKHFNKFLDWYKAILTGIVSVGAVFLQQLLQSSNLQLGAIGQFAVIVVVAIIFVQAMEVFANGLIENWSWLRKILLGKAFMEGFWVDITFDPVNKIVLFGAYSNFYYQNGQMIAQGRIFDSCGALHSRVESRSFEYTENGLKYGFSGPYFISDGSENKLGFSGYGEMRFDVRRGRPKYFSGFYIDTYHKKLLFFEGEKLDTTIVEVIETKDDELKLFLRNYIENFAKKKGFELLCTEELGGVGIEETIKNPSG